MPTLLDEAKAYEPPKTKNIADLDKIPLDIYVEDGEGETKEGEKFKYKYAKIDGEDYRIPGSVLGGIKTIHKKVPHIKFVQVIKEGSGMNTRYQVIPYTAPEK